MHAMCSCTTYNTVAAQLDNAQLSRLSYILQIATYKVRTVRVLEESRMTDSANENSGHISKSVTHPAVPSLSTSSVRISLLSQ